MTLEDKYRARIVEQLVKVKRLERKLKEIIMTCDFRDDEAWAKANKLKVEIGIEYYVFAAIVEQELRVTDKELQEVNP